MKIEVDLYRIPHCDHENCDLSQLEYDCPICGAFVLTCEGWYESAELNDFKLDCDKCKSKNLIKYDSNNHEWFLEN